MSAHHPQSLSARWRRSWGRSPCVWGLLLSILLAPPLSAQLEIKGGVNNNLSQRVPASNPGGIPPVGAALAPTGDPTITPQFANVVEASGSAGPISGGSGYPASASVILRRASMGTTFASGVPRYSFGDQITPPTVIINAQGTQVTIADPETYWRSEPVMPGEILTNPSGAQAVDYRTGEPASIDALPEGVVTDFYYSPHARRVFANTPGTVEITWRSSLPDASNSYVFYKERFTVSSATTKPVRTMFWTEKSFDGPPVNVPPGRIVTVNPIYSNVFPETVLEEVEIVGASEADPNADATTILRTVWYEKSTGRSELRAYNMTGRLLVEYLGEQREDGTHEFLGADIVSVEQRAEPRTLTVYLGEEIRPEPDEDLIALPVTSSNPADQVAFYGSNARPDGSLAYFAERENDIEDRVVFYWIEARDAGLPLNDGETPGLIVEWPKYLNKYLQLWPNGVTNYASYTVFTGGSSVDNGTGLKFEDGEIPDLIFQDAPDGDESVIDTVTQRLVIDLGVGGDQLNRTLLKFSGDNGGVWYVRILAQAYDREGFLEGDGGSAVSGSVLVGERIAPPSSAYSLAGFIAAGTSYSPSAYVDPFVEGIEAAEAGAIIPVNALPGDANPLVIWWFQKVPAPSGEFSDFYVPAKVGRYSVSYPPSSLIAAETFDSSATGWSNASRTSVPASAGTGQMLGVFGKSSSNPTTQKTFDLGQADANNIQVAFTFYRLLTWDNEKFFVYFNDNKVLEKNFTGNIEETVTSSGSFSYAGVDYVWTVSPVPGTYEPFWGTNPNWNSQVFRMLITARSSTATPLHSLKIGFHSKLNEEATNEAWAIDGLSIEQASDRQIVMASNLGTGDLSSAMAAGRVYNQPDPALPGYNPNEEHALLLNGRGYALRDDLNLSTGTTLGTDFTSRPLVLIEYIDPSDDRPNIAAYEVLRQTSAYPFAYGVTAGTILSSPMPLPLLPLPVDSNGDVRNVEVVPGSVYTDPPANAAAPPEYTPFTFKDRKGYNWVYRGPHDGGLPSLGMKFYYTMRPDFVFPNRPQPAEGTVLPYLRPTNPDGSFAGDAVTGDSLTILYYPRWPDDPPVLNVAETLTLPRRGLPSVRGQTSARVLYQQSIANSGVPAVKLHDPTRAKSVLLNDSSVGLNALPVSLKTTNQNGKTYFQLAQPHLQQRIYFDPNIGDIGGITFIGEFVDEIAGEDYLNLNTLSQADVDALRILVDDSDPDKSKWNAAIDALSTTVETFIENPNVRGTYIVDGSRTAYVGSRQLPEILYSDTAADSYALTALGQGTGYVTLLFSDGEAFTPQGEPVAMQVIEVAPKLYQGDLKKISASNPLDEQTTLRHSGDFAAVPDNYEFQWAYALPVNGMGPAIYEYGEERVIGTSSTNQWQIVANPVVSPPDLTYSGNAVPLSRSIQINNASYNPANETAGQILRSTVGLTFADQLPTEVIFSANLGPSDGLALYVNGHPAVAYQIPFGYPIPGNLSPLSARSGLALDGLTYQFNVDLDFFRTGNNTIEVALYSTENPGGASSTVDFRFHIPARTDLVLAGGSPWIQTPQGQTNTVIVGGSAGSLLGDPLLVFSDTYFTMRYRANEDAALVTGTSWSDWTQPVLVESWVKRVLDGINPFNQRQTDLYNNPVSTDVSLLTQAGARWEGDVALSIESIEDFGLIEIYETVLNRVKQQSLEQNITTQSVNDTLLLVAGYLNDLYMTLGDEAFDDSQNPTLLIDSHGEATDVATARFSFEGQLANLMDETLTLLRGRDDFLSPGTRTNPAYNRLYWNYTNGINSGEPFYAVNYDITEKAGGPYADGVVDASDAQYLFPQGHGDAYGHYLTALKGYYKLITSDIFTWNPNTEGVSVLGQTVQVDYQDERKFAAAAAALARTGVEVIDFTARRDHCSGEEDGWVSKRDGKYNSSTGQTRHWGTDEWVSRAYQGAYYNWLNANAMLPDIDNVNEGIQKIDRTTVPELNEIVTSANKILNLSFGEQAHMSPLGLASDAMAFDISASELAAGKSHFEQIYERAVQAALNAKDAFDEAAKANHLLRRQTFSLDEYNAAVESQEDAYEYQLITLFGTPYAGDIGPGKLYAQGYDGPDLYHSYFIDRPSSLVDVSADVTVEFREPVNHDPFTEWSVDNAYNRLRDPIEYTTRTYRLSPYTLGQFSDTVTAGLGRRSQTGEIQKALLDAYEATVALREASNRFDTLNRRFDRDYQLYSEFISDFGTANDEAAALLDDAAAASRASFALTTSSAAFALTADYISALADASAEAAPTSVGFSNDATSVARMLAMLSGDGAAYAQGLLGLAAETKAALLDAEAADLEGQAQEYIDNYNFDSVTKQHVVEFERLYDQLLATAYDITQGLTDLQRANERVARLYADADHILSERETFRQRAASIIQGYRNRDLVFRELRNEQLSQYKSLFNLAQIYAYTAIKAYDYETGLLGTPEGRAFLDQVIQTYSVGAWNDGQPIETGEGDSGLASILAALRDDWEVAKGRLGINNPDQNGTLFSLRQELFRIRSDQATADDDLLWQQVLQQHIMSNVLNDPDVAMYCSNIRHPDGRAVPGIVLSFATTIEPGLNFFGWPIAAGDHAYSQSSFATKIHSVGMVFEGYVGMDPFALGTPDAGAPASSAPYALSATPYVYLIPAGLDSMRAPPFGDTNLVRTWDVKDQALPLPKNLGASAFSSIQFFTPEGSLNEELWIRRKHQAFRAVDDQAYFYSSVPAEFTNRRLVGRSVWNSQWKIVLPAYTLLNDEQRGLDHFVQTVRDIKLFIRSYSHSGN